MASKSGRRKQKPEASPASSLASTAGDSADKLVQSAGSLDIAPRRGRKKKKIEQSTSKLSHSATSDDVTDTQVVQTAKSIDIAPRRGRKKKKIEQSTSKLSHSATSDDVTDTQVVQTAKSIEEKLLSDVDGMLDGTLQSIKKIASQITEFPPIILCQDFTQILMSDNTSKTGLAAGETFTPGPSTSSAANKSKKVNFSGISNKPSSSFHSHAADSSCPKTPRAGPSHNKVAFVTPGPNFTKQSEVKILRVPQCGETCISMAGSPLLVPNPAHTVPQLTIPTADGRVIQVIAAEGDNSFNDVLMGQLEMKPSVHKQLKKMNTILNKLLEQDK